MPVLPFSRVSLKAKKPLPVSYPKCLNTLGDHLRQKRLELKLLQKEVARRFGVDESTVYNWETNRTTPILSHIPKIIKFIQYIPWENPAQEIWINRQILGISQELLARQVGVDPGTLSRWEKGRGAPSKEQLAKLSELFLSLLSSFIRPEE
jgi:transcriptional regulator with XRE-family HTH domain